MEMLYKLVFHWLLIFHNSLVLLYILQKNTFKAQTFIINFFIKITIIFVLSLPPNWNWLKEASCKQITLTVV